MNDSHQKDDLEERLILVFQEQPQWIAYLRARLPNAEDAEDVLQEGFLRAVEKVHQVRTREEIRPWFYRVLENLVTDFYRKRGSERKRMEQLEGDLAADLADATAGQQFNSQTICRCFHERLDQLHLRYADLIRRVDLEGAPLSEVAVERGDSLNTLNVALHRARTALRKDLERFCGECARGSCLDCDCGTRKAAEEV